MKLPNLKIVLSLALLAAGVLAVQRRSQAEVVSTRPEQAYLERVVRSVHPVDRSWRFCS